MHRGRAARVVWAALVAAAAGCGKERLAGEIPCDHDGQCPGGFHCERCAGPCPPRSGRCAAGERGPAVSWLAPAPSAGPAQVGRSALFGVEATDPDGVAEVVFSLGGREVGLVRAPPWEVRTDLTAFPEGPAELVAEAWDARRLPGRAARDVVVDLTPPPLDASRTRLWVDDGGTSFEAEAGASEEGASFRVSASEPFDAFAPCAAFAPCRISEASLREAWVQAADAAGNLSAAVRVPEVRVTISARPPSVLGVRAIGTARRPPPASFGGEELLATELALLQDRDALKLAVTAQAVDADTAAAWIDHGAQGPIERCDARLAWHKGRKQVVLYGGDDGPCPPTGQSVRTDTWAWDGEAWTRLTGGYPIARVGPATATVGDAVLLHGGWNVEAVGDLYALGASAWQALAAGPARQYGCLAADADEEALQFGGLGPEGPSGETWSYRGAAGWSQCFPPGSKPAPRWRHGCARDERRGVVVLHGGFDGAQTLGDTWEWNGTAWALFTAPPPPPENQHVALAYDAVRGRVLAAGAGDYSSAVWEWIGAAWRATPVASGPAPEPRERFGAAYDAERGRLVVYGGLDAQAHALADTWELAWERWPRVLLSFAVSEADAASLHALSLDSDAPRALFWTGTAWSEDAAQARREDGRFHVLLEPEAPALRSAAVFTVDHIALNVTLRYAP